ncbi:hypothetical protein BDN72DRAFT_903925 [Pluteus cervinus]|uniref:Uncharacterized protein n=1 Tax=Pluteus cervinus TaxID=181527 RepID=A0ACD3A7D4_9AGAR|nr:hypothetical protein BDN72DRAFT_903925 [Pluteus cervinus]
MTFLEHVLNSDSGRSRVTISWTVYVCEVGTEDIACSSTGKADIPGYLLATRPFGRSVLIGTLLEAIDEANGATHWLDFIFGRDHAGLGSMWVSTIRSPVFGGQLRDPISGYEILGPYRQMRNLTGMPGPVYTDLREAVSCDSSSVQVQSFFQEWRQRKGIEPENHFFLIFEISARCLRHRRLSDAPPPPSPHITQPAQTHVQPPLSSDSASPPASTTQTPSPKPATLDLDDDRHRTSNLQTSIIPNEHKLIAGLNIEEVCQIIGISTAIYQAAFYHPATRNTPLYTVLRNLSPLLTILEVLELEDPKGNRSYAGGLVLHTVDVLEFFRWNGFSYNKKYIAFRWAQKIARATWRGAIPSKGKALYPLYRRWRGIVWFFQPGGGLDRETPPDKLRRSVDPDEVAAFELKQTMLLDKRTELEDVLILR